MPEEAAASKQAQPTEGGLLQRFGGIVMDALPAIISAAGFLGFVALIGGVIQWIRFSAAELPATTAVRIMPREELIAEGAVSMITWFGLGLLAVLAVYLLDRGGNATKPTRRGLAVLVTLELLVTLFYLPLDAAAYVFGTVWLIAVGIPAVRGRRTALREMAHVGPKRAPGGRRRHRRARGAAARAQRRARSGRGPP
jgi:hypothetical protein